MNPSQPSLPSALMRENEAENPNSGSARSSPESTPIMTPETSDDEEEMEDMLLVSPMSAHSPSGRTNVLNTSPPQLEYLALQPTNGLITGQRKNQLDLPTRMFRGSTSAATSSSQDDKNTAALIDRREDTELNSPPSYDEIDSLLDTTLDEQEDLLTSLIPDIFDDGDEFFQNTMSDTFYGAKLIDIRAIDLAIVNDISEAISQEPIQPQTRILKELKQLHEDETLPYISIAPIEGSLENCLASFEGSSGTPYAGGVFWLQIEYPPTYPMKPPHVKLLTPVYHPNIGDDGRVCIDTFDQSGWSPVLATRTIMLSILSVLHKPILEGALNLEIAEEFEQEHEDYCRTARMYTDEIAIGTRPDTSYLLRHTFEDS